MSFLMRFNSKVRLAPIYLAYLTTFGIAGGYKLMNLHSGVPEGFIKMFATTILGNVGMTASAYYLIVIMEAVIIVGFLTSLLLCEFKDGQSKPFLIASLLLAAVTFVCLGTGLRIAGDNSMAATLFLYFASTLLCLMYVESSPPRSS